jgi:hypothetical protein
MGKKASGKSKKVSERAAKASSSKATVELVSPRAARVGSPLALVVARYAHAAAGVAFVRVNTVTHVVELEGRSGELRENVTLLEGPNRLEVEVDGVVAALDVELPRSERVALLPAVAGVPSVATRALEVTGTFEKVSCPAGVIAVNGFMQQFALQGVSGGFAEKVVLRPGDNHLAVQIGEVYATRLVKGTFAASKLLATLVWNTNLTDVDLHASEAGGGHVYYANKQVDGTLDVDRTQGYGPENYSLPGPRPKPGPYALSVHYFADRGIGRTEWTCRVLTDEGTPAQRTRTFYGILNRTGERAAVCKVTVAADGAVTFG